MRVLVLAIVLVLPLALGAVTAPDAAAGPGNKCWGQATKVFARTGELGAHAAEQEPPRLGLRNLARALSEQGGIPDDSLAALGAFVAAELELPINACLKT